MVAFLFCSSGSRFWYSAIGSMFRFAVFVFVQIPVVGLRFSGFGVLVFVFSMRSLKKGQTEQHKQPPWSFFDNPTRAQLVEHPTLDVRSTWHLDRFRLARISVATCWDTIQKGGPMTRCFCTLAHFRDRKNVWDVMFSVAGRACGMSHFSVWKPQTLRAKGDEILDKPRQLRWESVISKIWRCPVRSWLSATCGPKEAITCPHQSQTLWIWRKSRQP